MRFLQTIKKGFMKIQYNSPFVLTYTLVSLLAVCLITWTGGNDSPVLVMLAARRTGLADPLQYLRLFTHAAAHINFGHYFSNFMVILIIGPMMEEKYGTKRLLLMTVITAFVTGTAFTLLSPAGHMLLGASGVVFMLILLGSYVNLQQGRIPLTLLMAVAIYLGNEIAAGVSASDNVSHLTHIIGGLCGAAMGFVINRKALRVDKEKETK